MQQLADVHIINSRGMSCHGLIIYINSLNSGEVCMCACSTRQFGATLYLHGHENRPAVS